MSSTRYLQKLYELLKGLLKAGLIGFSDSPWASPIVIVLKKNGEDIRLGIDFKMVNTVTAIMEYAMPLVDDLLTELESYLWFCSLDAASGFWAILMTMRARKVSAFVCALGHFEWLRMPFGLKNAQMIYQRMRDNAFLKPDGTIWLNECKWQRLTLLTSRVLKDAEMNYHSAEKEVLALLLLLKVCYTQLAGETLHVYTRYSTLAWVHRSKSFFGRAVQFAVLLSPWQLEVQRIREKDCLFSQLLQSTITNFVDLDESLALVAPPTKGSPNTRMDPSLLYAQLPHDYDGLVDSFGSAKTEKNGGYGS
ncbi:hypothetical protein PHMEG_00033867, partial [Phytophthora megakarya]